ncbi:GAF domain-containing protein A-like [Hippocampus zosterae]|uniref:GAF domain-containing protein A-like n=1 Tax=Hippocampus zosterae TaxID=109293 RepID=UPI00223D983B|nr:GAF domain-containing protein A-like [Hippocampus zosterae]
MPEDLSIVQADSKADCYQNILPQIASLVAGEPDLIANLANISAALMEQFRFLWVGYYLPRGDELVLGPFQGPVACTRIRKGKGVCGASWEAGKSLVVPDVSQFKGHIGCSSKSRSEICVPLFREGCMLALLDIDS